MPDTSRPRQTGDRVEFWPEDPCRLPSDFSQFGCVLVADTLTELSCPAQFLSSVHHYVVPGGCLVIASSYDWANSPLDKVGEGIFGRRQRGCSLC